MDDQLNSYVVHNKKTDDLIIGFFYLRNQILFIQIVKRSFIITTKGTILISANTSKHPAASIY